MLAYSLPAGLSKPGNSFILAETNDTHMKFYSITLCLLLCAMGIANAQVNTTEPCATQQVINHWNQQYPGFQDAVDAAFFHAQQHSKNKRHQPSNKQGSSGDTIYRIPVVVHIVYTSPAENFADSVVHSQIEVLNQAYRRTSADTAKTRDVFKPFAADVGIEFYLADTDPQGNPTTGITRTAGNPTGFLGFSPFDDNVKKTSLGGIDAWPTDQYLNIWVCDLLGGLGVLGYAYPPIGNLSNWPQGQGAPTDPSVQGVVIYYKVFGSNNPSGVNDPTYRDLATGKTTVHEVGHYLGLRHIWGDGDCTQDDFIFDTPFSASASQQQCNYNKNSCSDGCWPFTDLPDNIENYMDYSIDSCLNMFTQGQADLMRSMIALYRSDLPEIVIGNIAKPDLSAALTGNFVVDASGAVTIYTNYTFINSAGNPVRFLDGDTLYDQNNQPVIVDGCDSLTLTPGEFLVTPSGDTIGINVGDTVSTYDNGGVLISQYVDPTVGITETLGRYVGVYPNPNQGNFNLYNRSGFDIQELKVFNLMGEEVWSYTGNPAEVIPVEISGAPGVYLVKATINGESLVKKVMKH